MISRMTPWCLRVAGFLIAGVLTSYLVAWCGELCGGTPKVASIGGMISPPSPPCTILTEHRWISDSLDLMTNEVSFERAHRESLERALTSIFESFLKGRGVGFEVGRPGWYRMFPDDDSYYDYWHARAAGWPWRCVRACMSRRDDLVLRVHGAIDLQVSIQNPRGASRRVLLPLVPHWPGLAANTALYACLWASPFVAAWVWKHRLRRSGACRTCGYDLRGLSSAVCPECGSSRSGAPTANLTPPDAP